MCCHGKQPYLKGVHVPFPVQQSDRLLSFSFHRLCPFFQKRLAMTRVLFTSLLLALLLSAVTPSDQASLWQSESEPDQMENDCEGADFQYVYLERETSFRHAEKECRKLNPIRHSQLATFLNERDLTCMQKKRPPGESVWVRGQGCTKLTDDGIVSNLEDSEDCSQRRAVLCQMNYGESSFVSLLGPGYKPLESFHIQKRIMRVCSKGGGDLKRQFHDNQWFWQPFCVGENNGSCCLQLRQARGKRQLLEENDICSTQLGRWGCLRGWPSLMSATLARAVAIFCSRSKKSLIIVTLPL